MENLSLLNDLKRTVGELSDTYEELSLLYKLSDLFSTLDINEICENLVNEAIAAVEVKTAAVLFWDEGLQILYTKTCRGNWDKSRTIDGSIELISGVIEQTRAKAFCTLDTLEDDDTLHGLQSALLCPLVGKKKTVGLIVLGDKVSGDEFYSNDVKFLSIISKHAAMAIENALLYEEIEDLLLSTIRSFIKALETTTHWTAGHTERVTVYAEGIATEMGLSEKQIERLRVCSLLHDIGKIGVPREILNKKGRLDHNEWAEIRKHPLIGVTILSGLKPFSDILDGIKYHHEYWDGTKGIFGLTGENIPLMARILAVADAYDAMTSDRPYRSRKNKEDTIKEINEFSGRQFDPSVVDALLRWLNRQHPAS